MVSDVVAERDEKEEVVDVSSGKEMSESKMKEEAPKKQEETPKSRVEEETPKAKKEAEEEPMVQLEQSLYLKVGMSDCVHV